MVGHGSNVYLKGVAHRKPDYTSITKAFGRVLDVSKDGFQANVIYEYFPLSKIRSVPNGLSAFRRDPTPSILITTMWADNTTDLTDHARAIAYELAGIITGGQSDITSTQTLGYSNYGKSHLCVVVRIDCKDLPLFLADPEGVTGGKEAVDGKARLVFGENYPKLQQIKKKYDPENIFNKWFPITPAA